MQAKKIIFGADARALMLEGADILARAVTATLGPRGRNVIIKKAYGVPHITKDGVSVAKEVVLEDEFQDMGSSLILDAASRTNETVGDGTSSSTVVANAILQEGNRYILNGSDPMDIKRGMDIALMEVLDLLPKVAISVATKEQIIAVAKISANNDVKIAKLITEAIEAVGKDGLITVERGGSKDEIETINGFNIDEGYLTPTSITNQSRMVVEYNNPYIVLIDHEVNTPDDILRVLEIARADKVPMIIIAHSFSDEVIELINLNNLKGVFSVCTITAEGYSSRRSDILKDIAIYSGGEVISNTSGINLRGASARYFGKVSKVTASRTETSIIGETGDKTMIQTRVDSIKNQLEIETNQFNKDKLTERLSRLTNGAALIRVGGLTEVEMKERKDRIDDAICAARAASAEGIVPGGGVTLLRIAKHLKDSFLKDTDLLANEDQIIGVKILIKALQSPAEKILENAGEKIDVIIEKVLSENHFSYGYDSAARQFGNLVDLGVIDPVKVTRLVVENAVGVASLMLTTEVMIGFAESKKPNAIDVYKGKADNF
jgi:chaperonin GroEL